MLAAKEPQREYIRLDVVQAQGTTVDD